MSPDHQQAAGGGARARFLPFPDCRCERSATLAAAGLLSRGEAVSRRLGLVAVLERIGEGPRTTVRARGNRTLGSAGHPVLASGLGHHVDPVRAADLALSECVERYCAGFWNHSPATVVSGDDAEATTMVTTVGDGEPRDVPARTVYLPYPAASTVQDSVGLAAGFDFDAVVRRAHRERVERDVFWAVVAQGRVAGPVGDLPGRSVTVTAIGPDMHLACCVETRPQPPYLTFGLGCDDRRSAAVEKAEDEHGLVRSMVVASMAAGDRPPAGSPLDSLLWRVANDPVEAARLGRTLLDQPPRRPAPDGYAVIDLTTQDVAAFGYRVARVVPVDGGTTTCDAGGVITPGTAPRRSG